MGLRLFFMPNFPGATFIPDSKAELLQLKLTPIICLKNYINKKIGKRKKLSPPSIQLLKLI